MPVDQPRADKSNEAKAARLRRRAELCRDLAAAAPTEDERKAWLQRADDWIEQAEQLDKA